MFQQAIKSFLNFFKEEKTIVEPKKNNDLEYTLIENSGWKVVADLPDSFNPKKELFLVRYKNNPTKVFNIKYNAETKTILNNWDEVIKKEKVAVFLIISLDDSRWNEEELYFKNYYFNFDKNNILINLNNKFFHANYMNTGNRHGIDLCFYGSHPERITSTPKSWINIPKAFKEI